MAGVAVSHIAIPAPDDVSGRRALLGWRSDVNGLLDGVIAKDTPSAGTSTMCPGGGPRRGTPAPRSRCRTPRSRRMLPGSYPTCSLPKTAADLRHSAPSFPSGRWCISTEGGLLGRCAWGVVPPLELQEQGLTAERQPALPEMGTNRSHSPPHVEPGPPGLTPRRRARV